MILRPELFRDAIPPDRDCSVADWGRQHVRLIGSARSENFNPEITPWTIKPLECTDDGITRRVTFVKPVQAGGSVVGEVALCRWLAVHTSGDVQYNWEIDEKAEDRWDKRVEKILKACKPVMARWPADRSKARKGLVIFPHCNLTVQGVFTDQSVASDSIRFQINEEIHNWEAGRLAQAEKRTTAFWNSVMVDVSNAGTKDDQLHTAFKAGTMEPWQVKCPGCGKWHAMRARWEDKRPDLGGLRYNADGCRRGYGEYDYNKMQSSIRLQMPCGYSVHDDVAERRALSLTGDYPEALNPGASITHRSFTLEAVSVDYIPFMTLIREKHEALHAIKYGDPEPWKVYLRERECRFWDPEDRPLVGRIVVQTQLKKNREGLPGRFARFFALDRQQGEMAKGELPHWWLVIRDVMPTGDSLLVWEGKCLTDDDAIGIIREHGCSMQCGVADSGHDTTHVYQFCFRYGLHAVKGSAQALFSHIYRKRKPEKRIFSKPIGLHKLLGCAPQYNYVWDPQEEEWVPDTRESTFFHYSAEGIRERLHWLRAGGAVRWDVPSDVSEEYLSHMEAWELEEQQVGRSKETIRVWVQRKKRDDMRKCEEYIAMEMDASGVIGAHLGEKAAK